VLGHHCVSEIQFGSEVLSAVNKMRKFENSSNEKQKVLEDKGVQKGLPSQSP
jgi:hypothetical protein